MNPFYVKNSGKDSGTCKVIARLGDTLCSVKDRRGRKFDVESDGSYKVGTWVTVKNGIIIKRSNKNRTVTHYNV